MKIKLSKNNDHDGVLLCVKCAKEGDRIPPLESYGQPLEQEHRLSCVLSDCGSASANFLDQFDGRLVPGASSLHATGKKTCEADNALYFAVLLAAALLAAEPASLAVCIIIIIIFIHLFIYLTM